MQNQTSGDAPRTDHLTGNTESALISRTIAFQLRLAQAIAFQTFSQRAAEPAMQPGRYAILQFIADRPGIGQTALSQAVGRDKTTLTPTLTDLERRGLISRIRDPRDARARCLTLTAAGQALLARLASHADVHDRRIDAILGPNRDLLFDLLGQLIRGLEADIRNGD